MPLFPEQNLQMSSMIADFIITQDMAVIPPSVSLQLRVISRSRDPSGFSVTIVSRSGYTLLS